MNPEFCALYPSVYPPPKIQGVNNSFNFGPVENEEFPVLDVEYSKLFAALKLGTLKD
jgi:hypothetical protein